MTSESNIRIKPRNASFDHFYFFPSPSAPTTQGAMTTGQGAAGQPARTYITPPPCLPLYTYSPLFFSYSMLFLKSVPSHPFRLSKCLRKRPSASRKAAQESWSVRRKTIKERPITNKVRRKVEGRRGKPVGSRRRAKGHSNPRISPKRRKFMQGGDEGQKEEEEKAKQPFSLRR